MKTAVEWLENKINDELEIYNNQWLLIENFIEQAKEIEKEQKGYSEEDMIEFAKFMWLNNNEYKSYQDIFNQWFQKYKKL